MSATLGLAAPVRQRDDSVSVRSALAICVLLSVAVQGAVLVTPLLTMHVFDGVLRTRNLATLTVLAIAFLLALLLGGVLRLLRAALLSVVAERVGRRLQLRALTASVRVAMTGDTTRPALGVQDVAELRRLLGGTLLSDLLDLLAIPAALGFLWMLHPLFLAVGVAALLMKLALAFITDRATGGVVSRATAAQACSANELALALRQSDAVFGLGMLRAAIRRWTPGFLDALERQDTAQRRARALQGMLTLVNFAQQIAIVTSGAWLLIRQDASPGVMMAAMTMVGFATNPVVGLVRRWRDWAYGRLAWRRLHSLAEAGAPPAAAPREDAAPGLVFESVEVRVPDTDRVLVRNLSLTLASGQAWAVVGPNGIGKTSLLRATLGLAAPAAGRVLLDGQDTFRADRGMLGARLGYLPQEPQLLDGTVIENIGRFRDEAAAEAVAAARLVGAHDAIGRLHKGYDTPAGPAGGLSGGQQRLVALARALHAMPRLLVLDEPEAGLDAAARKGLREGVASAGAAGAVVLFVTHDATAWEATLDGVLRLGPDGAWQAEYRTETLA